MSSSVGSAGGSAEQNDPVDEFTNADKHEPDDALLQQPYDVLPDQHEASAGHKPKTDRQPVQPGRTTTVRGMKNARHKTPQMFELFSRHGFISQTASPCRMLLNQSMQTLVPTSSVPSQPSQCNMGISQTL